MQKGPHFGDQAVYIVGDSLRELGGDFRCDVSARGPRGDLTRQLLPLCLLGSGLLPRSSFLRLGGLLRLTSLLRLGGLLRLTWLHRFR